MDHYERPFVHMMWAAWRRRRKAWRVETSTHYGTIHVDVRRRKTLIGVEEDYATVARLDASAETFEDQLAEAVAEAESRAAMLNAVDRKH